MGRFTLIDGLRGFAAMAVVVFHAIRGNHLDIVSSDLIAIVVLGESGVAIFFVISGFVIAHSLFGRDMDFGGAWRFMLARSIRLDPSYWAAIVLAVGFSVLASAVIPGRPPAEYTFSHLLAHLFYMQEILGYRHVNPVFWTLCYEIQFYAVFALLLVSRSTAIFVLAFVASLLWPLGLLPEIRGVFVNLIYVFLLGVGAYHAWRSPGGRPWFLAYASIVITSSVLQRDLFALVGAVVALLLFAVAIAGSISSALNWKWLQFLGRISYSLYLIHSPITGATFRVWYMIAGHSPLSQGIGFALSMVACVACAWTMYMLIEKPCIALAKSSAGYFHSRSKGVAIAVKS